MDDKTCVLGALFHRCLNAKLALTPESKAVSKPRSIRRHAVLRICDFAKFCELLLQCYGPVGCVWFFSGGFKPQAEHGTSNAEWRGIERSQTCAWQRTDRLDQALVDVASKPNCILHCDCCQDQINNVCVRNRDGRWGDVDVEEDLGAP